MRVLPQHFLRPQVERAHDVVGVAGDVMYMIPATTIGVVSKLPSRSDPWV